MTERIQSVNWETIKKQEGCNIMPLSSEDTKEIGGGWFQIIWRLIRWTLPLHAPDVIDNNSTR